MNILKNVVNKIAESDKKTELASQKVELGLADDLLAQTKESQGILNDIENLGKQVEKKIEEINAIKKQLKSEISATKKIQKSLNGNFNKYDKWEARSDKLYKKVVRIAEDLGIKPNKVDGVQEWLDEFKTYKKVAFKYGSLADKDLEK